MCRLVTMHISIETFLIFKWSRNYVRGSAKKLFRFFYFVNAYYKCFSINIMSSCAICEKSGLDAPFPLSSPHHLAYFFLLSTFYCTSTFLNALFPLLTLFPILVFWTGLERSLSSIHALYPCLLLSPILSRFFWWIRPWNKTGFITLFRP